MNGAVRPLVLYLGPRERLEEVRGLLLGCTVQHAETAAEADRWLGRCDAVLDASLQVPFGARRLALARRLQLFVAAATGADHVDAGALARQGVPLLTMQDQQEVLREITATAEHAWLLLLACARRLRGATEDVLHGGWRRQAFAGMMLRGKILGVIGCGRLGQWMARYAETFGMRILGYDPHVSPWPEGIERRALWPLLEASDVVSVHAPLNEQTRHLLGPEAFRRLKPGAVLVNTSRGAVVDEQALLAALERGQVAAAGLDVLEGEPNIARHPLVRYARTHTNLIITPHLGGCTPEALRPVLACSCRRIADHFAAALARPGAGRAAATAGAAR